MIGPKPSQVTSPKELSNVDYGSSNQESLLLSTLINLTASHGSTVGLISLLLISSFKDNLVKVFKTFTNLFDSLPHLQYQETFHFFMKTISPSASQDQNINGREAQDIDSHHSFIGSIYYHKGHDGLPSKKNVIINGPQYSMKVLDSSSYFMVSLAIITSMFIIIYFKDQIKKITENIQSFLTQQYNLVFHIDLADLDFSDFGVTIKPSKIVIQDHQKTKKPSPNIDTCYLESIRRFKICPITPNNTPYGTLKLSSATLPLYFPKSIDAIDYENFQSIDIDQ